MDSHSLAILLSFALYVLYIILPMVPAILIYKWFPDTKVGVKGPLGNLTMKATGAFAAYVITVILGFFLVNNTHQLIAGMVHPTWTIKAKVELRDINNEKINDRDLLNTLKIGVKPDIVLREENFVQLELPGGEEIRPYLSFYVPNFGKKTICLSDMDSTQLERDKIKKTLSFVDPIIIKVTPEYTASYTKADYLQPTQAEGPPLQNYQQ